VASANSRNQAPAPAGDAPKRIRAFRAIYDLVCILRKPVGEFQKGNSKKTVQSVLRRQGIERHVVLVLSWVINEYRVTIMKADPIISLEYAYAKRALVNLAESEQFLRKMYEWILNFSDDRIVCSLERVYDDLKTVQEEAAVWVGILKHTEPERTNKRGRPAEWRTIGAIAVLFECVAWQVTKAECENPKEMRKWALNCAQSIDPEKVDIGGAANKTWEALICLELPEDMRDDLGNTNAQAAAKILTQFISTAGMTAGFERARKANENLVGAMVRHRRSQA
jgi:hypothetical protein